MRLAWRRVPEGTPRRDTAFTLLRELLPGARLTNPCPSCGGPHGPVRVHGASAVASVTYAARYALVAVAASDEYVAIGVDAEADAGPSAGPGSGLSLDRVLPSASLPDWVRVEAVLKADGRGLRVDPSEVDIHATPEGWTAHVADRPGIRYEVRDLEGPPGVLVSVALRPAT